MFIINVNLEKVIYLLIQSNIKHGKFNIFVLKDNNYLILDKI